MKTSELYVYEVENNGVLSTIYATCEDDALEQTKSLVDKQFSLV